MSHVKRLVESYQMQAIFGYFCDNCASSLELEDLVWDIEDKPFCKFCGNGGESAIKLTRYGTGNGTEPFEAGDLVYWHDPDDDTCSRILRIESILGGDPNHLVLLGTDGSELHCTHRELEAIVLCPKCEKHWKAPCETEAQYIKDHGHCYECYMTANNLWGKEEGTK